VTDDASDRAALLIIDMQVGVFTPETPRHDAEGVIARINAIASALRRSGGTVVFIQHDGPKGDTFEPGKPGWQLLSSLERESDDQVVHKTACDSFYDTDLSAVLSRQGVRRLLVTGCATDFCVDTTVRAAMSREYEVLVVADAHTTANRPHVDALSLIRHHNWLWQDLIHPKVRVQVVAAHEVVAGLEQRVATGSSRPTSA
jgi:nicotinamidase-related amidase